MDNDLEEGRTGSYRDFRREVRERRRGCMGPSPNRNWPARQGAGFAVLLIAAGVLLFLDNIGIVRLGDLWQYWPLFISLAGFQHMLSSTTWGSKVWGGLLVVFGVLWVCKNMGIINWGLGALIALVLIGAGFSLLVSTVERRDQLAPPMPGEDILPTGEQLDPNDEFIKDFVIFFGSKRRVLSQRFVGAELGAVFGGIEMDLRRAGMSNANMTATIDAVAVFGGINIKVPHTWRVVVKGTGVFGGYEDKSIPPTPTPGVPVPTLVVNGGAVFGGVVVE